MDLLAVVKTRSQHPTQAHKELNLSIYTEDFLLNGADKGNLFVLHLIKEAKVLYDPKYLFEEVRRLFRLQDTYAKDIQDASALGWFLISHAEDVENWELFNKRVAWCVRTILIARAVESTRFIFSAQELGDFSRSGDAVNLVNNKDSSRRSDWALFRFAEFLSQFGTVDRNQFEHADLSEQLRQFRLTGNNVGQNTASALLNRMISEYTLEQAPAESAEEAWPSLSPVPVGTKVKPDYR